MKSNDASPKSRILELLEAAPMRTGEIAKKLGMTEAGAGFHLKALEQDKKIAKSSRRSPYALLNGKGEVASEAPRSSPGRATTKKKVRAPVPTPAKNARGGGAIRSSWGYRSSCHRRHFVCRRSRNEAAGSRQPGGARGQDLRFRVA